MKFCYPAVFKKHTDGHFEVRFPDLDQCIAEGKDFETALFDAKDSERAWLEAELEDQMEFPMISSAEEIELAEDEFIQNVTVNIRLMEGYDE